MGYGELQGFDTRAFRVQGVRIRGFVRVGMISGPSRSGAVGAWELRTKLREPLSPLKGPYSPLKGAL